MRTGPTGDTTGATCRACVDDGAILVSGRYALIMLREGEVADSAMWYEVQSARWEGEKQELSVNWVDPARSPLVVRSSRAPMRPFMEDISEKVNRTQVLVRSIKAPNGAVITAQIRKREDGELFSVLAARGRLLLFTVRQPHPSRGESASQGLGKLCAFRAVDNYCQNCA